MTQSQLSAGLTTGKEGEGGEAAQRTDVSAALRAGWKLRNRRCEEQRNTSVFRRAETASLTFSPQRPSQSILTPQELFIER